MEEVVKQLTTLVSTGPYWPYTLVWLNGDTHHVPLPREGYLSVTAKWEKAPAVPPAEGSANIEICQLLILSSLGHLPSRAE